MKKIIKFFTLLTALFLTACFGTVVSAAGSVTYHDNANEFIFAPGTEQSPTNLFENFQNVMPGDTLTESILIKNDASNEVKIKVYLRSLGARKKTDEFLSQMDLTVHQEGDSVLFEGSADTEAQLTDWVCLGTVYSGGEITLDVTLEVPAAMGNEYQNETGYIDWEFKVEELPVDSSDPGVPQTGDTNPVILYFSLMLISFAVWIKILTVRKYKE